ncbi:MAG: aldo/keto reductase [Alphaproteobacteria bacterium]
METHGRSEDQTAQALLGAPALRLGFGCGELYAGRDRALSRRLIETAIDHGVSYFDTARLYGHGKAEGILGEVLRGRRHQVTLASKAGILPTDMSLRRRIADKATTLVRAVPPLRRFAPPPKPAEPTFGVFGVAELRASVDTSLRELGTDYLDLLFLHECTVENATDPDVVALLSQLKSEGKIRAWGVATSVETILQLAPMRSSSAPQVLQFPSSAWNRNIERVAPLASAPLVTHSVLGGRFRDLVRALRDDQRLRAQAIALGVDPDDGSALAAGMLAAQLHANPEGVVLFSTSSPERLAANILAAGLPAERAAAAVRLAEAHAANEPPDVVESVV